MEEGYIYRILNDKWNQLGHNDEKLTLQIPQLETRDPPNSNQKAIEFVFHGRVTSPGNLESFMATIHTSQVPSPETDIYKNKLQNEVFVSGIEDEQKRYDIKQSVLSLANVLSDWTNNHLNDYSSQQFYALHLLAYVFTRIAGKFHTNGQSCFIDFSTSDVHLTKLKSDSIQNFYSDLPVQMPRFFGIIISDKFIEEFVKEHINRRKRMNVLEYIELFPEFDQYSKRMKVEEASDIFPNLLNTYLPKKRFSLELNPKDLLQEGLQYSLQNTFIKFGQDEINMQIPFIFDILVGKTLFSWDRIAKGYLGIGGLSKIKQCDEGTLKFNVESNVRIQKLVIQNISTSQNMVEEEATIFALGNLLLKQLLAPPLSYEFPLFLEEDQVQFDIERLVERKIKAKFIPGFFELKVNPIDFSKIPQEGLNLKQRYRPISEGFNNVEQKKAAWELRLKQKQKEQYQDPAQISKQRRQWYENLGVKVDWLL
ncbi:UNKNOWN [Stylonychia lemnae]|uniref:Uncharacterized protein n=1 Tax=Stylonychia lemnae TaxID=5949 RepID=A0A078BD26_STYLE|nr:UNKNOWN [Stylonychia lemnae]|eukprot:CDW91117.1 UNKNOWN [Stylonychia lemnae]